jgi:hypothetical protein
LCWQVAAGMSDSKFGRRLGGMEGGGPEGAKSHAFNVCITSYTLALHNTNIGMCFVEGAREMNCMNSMESFIAWVQSTACQRLAVHEDASTDRDSLTRCACR